MYPSLSCRDSYRTNTYANFKGTMTPKFLLSLRRKGRGGCCG